jgi:hypothetical protein
MGGGMNQREALVTNHQTDQTSALGFDTNKSDMQIATTQSNAVIKQAELDAQARIKEAELNLEAVKYQADNDFKIAKMEFEVEMEKAKNDALRITSVEQVNAQANLTSAKSEMVSAEADKIDSQNKAPRDWSSMGYHDFYNG